MSRTDIKVIQTHYDGYWFRSRLEARWAVFFNALGVRYEYEKEGYDLDPFGYYLPDFWLPVQKVWVETKGDEVTPEEHNKAKALAIATGYHTFIVTGFPGLVDILDGDPNYSCEAWLCDGNKYFAWHSCDPGADAKMYRSMVEGNTGSCDEQW